MNDLRYLSRSGGHHWTKRWPERVKRGSQHWTQNMPLNRRAFGARNGAHMHPERVLRGEQVGTSKLQEPDIVEIRAAYKGGFFNMYELAELYEVSRTLIGYIVNRRLWAHVA
jgi:hypothetical protein